MIVPLDPARVDEAAAVLARAFQNDPLQMYTFPHPGERAVLSVPQFKAILGYGLLAGEVFVTGGDIRGAAIWWPPEHRTIDEKALEDAGFTTLPAAIGQDAFKRFMQVIDYVERSHSVHAPGPHYYAMVLGVDPVHHCQGIGGELLRHTFRRADALSLPCYLETLQPQNVRFYRNQGFDLVEEGREPESGLPFWAFLRPPANGR